MAEDIVEKSKEIETNSNSEGSKPDHKLPSSSSDEQLVNEWIDILGNGQLRKRVMRKGLDETRPNRGDMCTLQITGKLEDGTIVEDYDNFTVQLGDMEVIQGLDMAIALMDVNEVAEIEVNPRFAYGQLGRQPNIPPDAVINYIVELQTVQSEFDMETLNMKQRQEIGCKKRERGNWWYIREEPLFAIQCYRRALEFISPNGSNWSTVKTEEPITDAELQSLLEDRMKIYNNLAAAQMKTQAYDAALESVNNVLNTQPKNVKALFRKGKILHKQGEYMQAYITLLQAAKLKPDLSDIKNELIILKVKLAKSAQSEKKMYRKMFAEYESNGKLPKEDKNRISRSILWSIVGASVVIMSIFVYRLTS